MKSFIILAILFSAATFGETSKKVSPKVLPKSQPSKKAQAAKAEVPAPCADSKEDILKKLEEKKNAETKEGKGFSLQGATDTGCSVK